jgi:phosphatidylglycerol:prolipoprotein diacylglycerol transferase
MYPVLIDIEPLGLVFHTYVVMLSAGFLLAVMLIFRHNERREQPLPMTPMGALFVFVCILLGSRLYHILEYEGWRNLLDIWRVWQGGLVSYGGIIGAFAGGSLYLWWNRVPFGAAADIVLLYAPLGHAVGRLGCFFNGCCYGRPTDWPWGIVYPEGTPARGWLFAEHIQGGLITTEAAHHLPVHPTQLYDSAGLFLIFLLLLFWYPRRRFDGAFLVVYPGLYGIMRFTVEWFRGDTPLTQWETLTRSQLISLVLAVTALILYPLVAYLLTKKRNEGDGKRVDSPED